MEQCPAPETLTTLPPVPQSGSSMDSAESPRRKSSRAACEIVVLSRSAIRWSACRSRGSRHTVTGLVNRFGSWRTIHLLPASQSRITPDGLTLAAVDAVAMDWYSNHAATPPEHRKGAGDMAAVLQGAAVADQALAAALSHS